MQPPVLSWEDAQTFLAVIESRSFSQAARSLGLGQPTISRRIQTLERALGQPLFIRGKHGAEPTSAACRLQPAAEQMARWATEFRHLASGAEQEVSGVVRIAAPPGIAVEHLAPFAAMLKGIHPALTLEVLAAIDHVDLTRGVADIAIRTQMPNEPELTCVHEARSQPKVYASRAYAAKLHQPCTWAELDWVTWAGRFNSLAPRPMLEKLIPDFAPVFSSDDYLVQKSAVRAGLGVMISGEPLGADSADWVAVDVGIKLPEVKFYVVCAKSMQQVPRVRAVVEQLVAFFS